MRKFVVLLVALCLLFSVAFAGKLNKNAHVAAPQQKNDEVLCAICQFVVAEVENITLTDEASVLAEIEKVCSFLPTDYQGMCETLLQAEGPAIIANIIAKETPATLCSKLRACPAAQQTAPQKPVASQPKEASGLECSLCTLIMNWVEQQVGSQPAEQEVEKALDEVCNALPHEIQDYCNELVQAYYPVLVQYITSDFPAAVICQKIGLCNTTKVLEVVTPATASGIECEACQFIMNYIAGFISSNGTEEEVLQELQSVCPKLPSWASGYCSELMAAYGPELAAFIVQEGVNELNQFCTQIGLCSSSSSSSVVDSNKGGFECDACNLIMSFVSRYITANGTQQEIEHELQAVCQYLPSWATSYCNEFIGMYGAELAAFIVKEGVNELDQFCSQIGLCTSVVAPVAPVTPVVEASSSGLKCAICEYIMAYAENLLQQNTTEQELEKFFDKICLALPATFQDACVAIIADYEPMLIQLLLNGEQPSKVCAEIKLCDQTVPAAPVTTVQSGALCPICEYLVSFIESYVGNQATEEKVAQALDKVCSVIPKSYQSACEAIVNNYAPVLISAILNKETPSVVCTQVKLCTATQFDAESVAAWYCPACEFAMAQLENYLQNNHTDEEILNFLKDSCHKMPGELQSYCDLLINLEGPKIIELLDSIPPSQICTEIHACARSSGTSIAEPAANSAAAPSSPVSSPAAAAPARNHGKKHHAKKAHHGKKAHHKVSFKISLH